MNIKAIGFDFGGVISTHQSVMPEISQITGVALEEIKTIYFANNKLANLGHMSYDELWEMLLGKLGKSDNLVEVLKHLAENSKADISHPVLDLIDELRSIGFKVGMFSNNTSENGNIMREEGIEKHFDVFLISADIGVQKPEPAAFYALFDALGVNPQESVYIDDSEHSLSLSEEIGYHPILFKSYDQLIDDLTQLGILGKSNETLVI